MNQPLNPFEQVIFDHEATYQTRKVNSKFITELTCACSFDSWQPTPEAARADHARHVYGELRRLFQPTW